MKTIKQSRLDRLARRKRQLDRRIAFEKKLTKDQRIERENQFLQKIARQCEKEGMKKCPHGFAFSGFECLTCNADKIADRIREEWSPIPSYKCIVIDELSASGGGSLPLTIKSYGITKKIKEMQDNGFWYVWRGSPVFMTPGHIRVVILDGVVRNPSNTDPTETPDPKEHGARQSSRR